MKRETSALWKLQRFQCQNCTSAIEQSIYESMKMWDILHRIIFAAIIIRRNYRQAWRFVLTFVISKIILFYYAQFIRVDSTLEYPPWISRDRYQSRADWGEAYSPIYHVRKLSENYDIVYVITLFGYWYNLKCTVQCDYPLGKHHWIEFLIKIVFFPEASWINELISESYYR